VIHEEATFRVRGRFVDHDTPCLGYAPRGQRSGVMREVAGAAHNGIYYDDAYSRTLLPLLTLQMSFLLPPLGYAVMMSGARITPHPTQRQLVRALAPYLLGLAGVLALALAQPRFVHVFDEPVTAEAPKLTPEEVERLMRSAPRGVEP
jgi:hypothetical protein